MKIINVIVIVLVLLNILWGFLIFQDKPIEKTDCTCVQVEKTIEKTIENPYNDTEMREGLNATYQEIEKLKEKLYPKEQPIMITRVRIEEPQSNNQSNQLGVNLK